MESATDGEIVPDTSMEALVCRGKLREKGKMSKSRDE